MKQTIKIALLTLAVVFISACGKTGDLETVKEEVAPMKEKVMNDQAIDAQTIQTHVAPEESLMPSKSK